MAKKKKQSKRTNRLHVTLDQKIFDAYKEYINSEGYDISKVTQKVIHAYMMIRSEIYAEKFKDSENN